MPLTVNTHHSGDPVRAFVETVVFEAGFSGLEPVARAELVAALLVEAYKRVGLDLLSSVDKDSIAYFKELQGQGAGEDELSAFFRVRVPDVEDRVRKSLTAFGTECLRIARDLGGAMAIRV